MTSLEKSQPGLFGISGDFLEKYQSLDERYIKNKESTFFFEATGTSMQPSIYPGETLIVDRSITNWSSKICIVSIEGSLSCKRVFVKGDHIELHSENPKIHIKKIYQNMDSVIWGVVIAKIKEFL